MVFVTPVVEHWLEREIAQWVHSWRIDPTTHRTMSERSTSELRPAPGEVRVCAQDKHALTVFQGNMF